MNYRRYYPRGSQKAFVLSDAQFDELVQTYGFEEAVDRDNAEIELIPQDDKEAIELFLDGCERVRSNTRYYLDNIDQIPTFNMRYIEFYKYIENTRKTENFINRNP